MITIVIDDRGLATVEIPDTKGEMHHYVIRPMPPGLDDRAFILQRCDAEGAGYRVGVQGDSWRCRCPDWKYRGVKDQPAGCKHTRACAALLRFINSLETKHVEAEHSATA